LPSEQAAKKFQKRFRHFCQRHKTTPPDTTGWDAPQFATFLNGLQVPAPVGHSMDREQKAVHFGRAFLLTRRPFFLTFPLSKGQI
jgi:hypothetical protein